MVGPRASAHLSTGPYYLKEGVVLAELNGVLSLAASCCQGEGKGVRSGGTALRDYSLEAWEQRPEPLEWPHVSAASVGQWGAELPSAAGWHAHTLHRHASSDAQEGGRANHVLENSTTSLTWVLCFNFIKTICQHRQKVKKVDNEHCGLNTGLHAALSVPSTVHTLTHKHLSPDHLKMSYRCLDASPLNISAYTS